jgi:DNA adenine methylase
MQYRGGKARIAKRIVDAVDKEYEYTRWVEPFAGMANLSRYTKAQDIYLNDLDINIYTFLKELYEQGWGDLPDFVSEAEYREATNLDPSLLKTFIKIGCSFGGAWDNGYARSKPRYGKSHSYARNSKNACARLYEAWGDKNLTFSNKSYAALGYKKTDLIYCDPPYKNTRGFKVGKFDSDEFFNWMRTMHQEGYQIVCSEYSDNLPDDATVIWRKDIKQSVGNNAPKTEIVFCFNG